jgi:hypothetical protein
MALRADGSGQPTRRVIPAVTYPERVNRSVGRQEAVTVPWRTAMTDWLRDAAGPPTWQRHGAAL